MKNDKCFAYKRGKCIALKELDCKGCTFYKDRTQQRQSIYDSYKRIDSLSNAMQMYISDVFYEGEMPWRIEDEDDN